MATFDLLANLPLEIEGYELQGLEYQTPGFERLSTVIHLWGGGEDGLGEDVTYDALDHVALQDAGADARPDRLRHAGRVLRVHRRRRHLPGRAAARRLAPLPPLGLRVGGARPGAAPGGHGDRQGAAPRARAGQLRLLDAARRRPRGRASSIETLRSKLGPYPDLRFKLDPTNDWDDELIAALVETGAIDSLDLKGFYKGTPVDVETDPELYGKLIEAFPEAWLEDPDVNDETRPLLEPVRDRITWDAPIHSIADIEAMPWRPRMVNVKPSRIGGLRDLCETYDYCDEEGIGAYGGGQWELGPGRGQIQVLASLFHPDTPNDTAPRGYNESPPPPGLPTSPLLPQLTPTGFRWARASSRFGQPNSRFRLRSESPSRHARRPMADKSFADALNEQIANEFAASQQYVGMAVYYDAETLPRLAAFFYRQALEEREHAMMMVQYLLDVGEEVHIPDIKAQATSYSDGVTPVEKALAQEKRVGEEIFALFELAREEKDYRASSSCSGSSRSRSRRSR